MVGPKFTEKCVSPTRLLASRLLKPEGAFLKPLTDIKRAPPMEPMVKAPPQSSTIRHGHGSLAYSSICKMRVRGHWSHLHFRRRLTSLSGAGSRPKMYAFQSIFGHAGAPCKRTEMEIRVLFFSKSAAQWHLPKQRRTTCGVWWVLLQAAPALLTLILPTFLIPVFHYLFYNFLHTYLYTVNKY